MTPLKRRAQILLGALLFASATAFAVDCPLTTPAIPLAQISISIDQHTHLQVEVARSRAERKQGLMCRTALPKQGGMLLSYAQPRELRIWMKNMRMSLDILFLDHQGRVVKVVEQVPPCRQPQCPIYFSGKPASYALEIEAGSARKMGIRPGQRLIINPLAGVGAAP